MAIGEICSREVVFVTRNESVADAARLMRKHHIGSVVVVDRSDGRLLPVGMITDRDVAVGVVALGLDPEKAPVEGVMRADIALVRDTEGVRRTVQLMRAQELFGEELSCLAAAVGRGTRREREERQAPL